MNNQNNKYDELKSLNSDLPQENGKLPFSVPEGYFDGLAASIMSRIKKETQLSVTEELKDISPLLAGISRKMPYSVPENYFESVLEDLEIVIGNEQPSLLLPEHRVIPYVVPEGYFDSLPAQILSHVGQDKVKVVPIMARKWMRIAVAAVVAGIICISGIFYFSTKNNQATPGEASVAVKLKNIPTTELDAFINSVDADPASRTTAKNDASSNSEDVKHMLRNIPDNEIDAFLKQVPSDETDLDFN